MIPKACRDAVERWGDMQYITTIEEAAEVQQAISKVYRTKERFGDGSPENQAAWNHLAEEVADLEIMLMQLRIMGPCNYPKLVEKMRAEKLCRLKGKLLEY